MQWLAFRVLDAEAIIVLARFPHLFHLAVEASAVGNPALRAVRFHALPLAFHMRTVVQGSVWHRAQIPRQPPVTCVLLLIDAPGVVSQLGLHTCMLGWASGNVQCIHIFSNAIVRLSPRNFNSKS